MFKLFKGTTLSKTRVLEESKCTWDLPIFKSEERDFAYCLLELGITN